MSKHLLVLGAPHSGKLRLVQALCKSLPDTLPAQGEAHSGIIHLLEIHNKYYACEVGVWIDELPALKKSGATLHHSSAAQAEYPTLEAFVESYLNDEAQSVREVIGAIVFCFDQSLETKELESQLSAVNDIARACSTDVVLLGVGFGSLRPEDRTCLAKNLAGPPLGSHSLDRLQYFDDLCYDYGFVYAPFDGREALKNEDGELIGITAIRNIIEAYPWKAHDNDPNKDSDVGLDDLILEAGDLKLGLLSLEANAESLQGSEEMAMEEYESMISTILAAKEHLQDLTEEERKKQALELLKRFLYNTSQH